MTRINAVFVATALVLAASACSSSGSQQGSASTLEFAIFHDYSGPNAAYGPEASAGCFPAARVINAAGGVLGHKISCVPVDAKGDPADAVPAANRLIAASPSLVGVLGGGSDDATAVVPLFEQARIPIFSTTGQDSFDHARYHYFWRILSPDGAQGYAMAAAAKKLGYTRVATVFGNDAAAQGSAPTAIAGVHALGLSLAASQSLAVGQPSYRSEAQRIGGARPQAIISEADPQTSATYFAEVAQLGTLPGLITDPVSQEPNWIKAMSGAVGSATLRAKDTAVVAYAPATTLAYRAYTAALLASKSVVPGPAQWDADLYSVADYDSIVIMALAMIAAHSTSPATYNSFISKITSPSAAATIVHTFAAGKAALQAGKRIQYIGAVGPTVFNQWHNSGQGFAMEQRTVSGSWRVVNVLTAAEVVAASR
ncbi:MAG TPA: ABC transporter substrate-binding protein [Streptosporangiaceae bacterium]|nr:ABC transporter substrate-binding protein [Streptosporangiaceae bacterium]